MINQCTFIGRLTRDPEPRRTQNGTAITNFSLALDESYKDKAGEWVNKAVYADFQVWNGSGENLCKIAAKGDLLYVQARYGQDEWTDDEGNKRTKTRFTALAWKLLSKKGEKKVSVEEEVDEPAPTPEGKKEKPAKPAKPAPVEVEDDDDDDGIPF